MQNQRVTRLKHNLLTGLWAGLAMGVVCSIFALLLVAVGGGEAGLEDAYHATVSQLLLSYAVWGAVGGLIWGVLRPLNKWWWGAAITGYCAMLPFCWAVMPGIIEVEHARGSRLTLTLVSSLVGAVAGGYFRFRAQEDDFSLD